MSGDRDGIRQRRLSSTDRVRRFSSPLALLLVAGTLLGCFGWLIGAFDLESGLRAGHALIQGRSPYSPVTSRSFRAGHAFVYPYLVAWAFVPLAALPTATAVAIFVGLSAGAVVVACHLLGRTGWLTAALILSSSTTIVGLQMGTVNALLLLGAAVAWAHRDRWVVAGLAVAATAAAKLFLLPLLAWLLLARRIRAACLAAGVLAVALGAGWAFGPLSEPAYSAMLGVLQRNEAASSWSLTSFLVSMGVSAGAAGLIAMGIAGIVVVAGAIRSRRCHDERNLFAAAIIASLLATPIMWSSYLLIVAAVVLVVATDDRTVAALAVGSWVIVTPDVASLLRIAIGVALTTTLAGATLWQEHKARREVGDAGRVADAGVSLIRGGGGRTAGRMLPYRLQGMVARGSRIVPGLAVVLVAVLALAVLPPAMRSALPALMLVGAAALEVVRQTGDRLDRPGRSERVAAESSPAGASHGPLQE